MASNGSSRRGVRSHHQQQHQHQPHATKATSPTAAASKKGGARGENAAATSSQLFFVRRFVLTVMAAYFVQKSFRDVLLPHGGAAPWTDERLQYASIDFSNDLLRVHHNKTQKIYERLEEGQEPLLKGPETILTGKDGTIYLMSEEGKLLKVSNLEESSDGVTVTAKVSLVHSLGMGRPLGGRFTMDGKTLYVADAHLGLTRLRHFQDHKSKVELVTDTAVDADGNVSQILYANDVAIGPKTGKVYFTDSTTIAPDRIGTRSYDTMYAAKLDLLRGNGTGRVLEYDPHTDVTKVLVSGLHFANGIAVNKDETFLFFAECLAMKLWMYHLTGEKAGTLELVVDSKEMTGYIDGTDCAWSQDSSGHSKCYAVIISAVVPLHKLALKLPHPMDAWLRTLLMMLPKALAPPTKRYSAIVEVDPITKQFRYIQDPTGQDVAQITGVTHYAPNSRDHSHKLYLGSLTNDYFAVYHLD